MMYEIEGQRLSDIADAIRSKTGKSALITPEDMPNEIESIPGGSSTLITKSITQNGTYYASTDNADGYSQVEVNVSGGGETIITENVIPRMTSNTTPAGTASASSSLNGSFLPYFAFDRVAASGSMQGGWLADSNDYTPWIRYDFASDVNLYALKIFTANNGGTATKTVTIEGLVDGVWKNILDSGNTAELTFTQGTSGFNCVEHKIKLNGDLCSAIRIAGNERFYYGPNQTACTFSEIEAYGQMTF